jgi:hypothetical protein
MTALSVEIDLGWKERFTIELTHIATVLLELISAHSAHRKSMVESQPKMGQLELPQPPLLLQPWHIAR